MDAMKLKKMASECESELLGHILPFWLSLADRERGGFYGLVKPDLHLLADAPKGTVLQARILWAFSAVYLKYPEQKYLDAAAHAYAFLQKAWDTENSGFFWSLTAEGNPCDTDKYAYCNAFCILALTKYAEASGDSDANALALRAFQCTETHFRHSVGYLECFSADWQPRENQHFADHGLHAVKTLNTALHLIEAYAELYRTTGDENAAAALRQLLPLISDTVYDPKLGMLHVFFDAHMRPLGMLHSYGHDIEASWLVNHACDCLGDATFSAQWREIGYKLADRVYFSAFQNGALYREAFGAQIDKTRVWWVQAEGVIGFLNAARTALDLKGDAAAAERYLRAAASLWDYIRTYQIDRREGGEWYAETNTDGVPGYSADMAGVWKCPYHNTRMCLEVIERAGYFSSSQGFIKNGEMP